MASLLEVVKCHCLEGVTGNSTSDKYTTTLGKPHQAHSGNGIEEDKDALIARLKKELEEKHLEVQELQEKSEGAHSDAESEAESTTDVEEDAPDYARNLGVVKNAYKTLNSSALAFALPLQILTFAIAFGLIVFVLIAHSQPWGKPEHRRLQVNNIQLNRISRTPTLFEPELVGMRLEDLGMDEYLWSAVDMTSSISDYLLGSTPERQLNDDSHDATSHGSSGAHDDHDHSVTHEPGPELELGLGDGSSDGGHDSGGHSTGDHSSSDGSHDSGDHSTGGHDSTDGGHDSGGHTSGDGGHDSGDHSTGGHDSTDGGHDSGSSDGGHDGGDHSTGSHTSGAGGHDNGSHSSTDGGHDSGGHSTGSQTSGAGGHDSGSHDSGSHTSGDGGHDSGGHDSSGAGHDTDSDDHTAGGDHSGGHDDHSGGHDDHDTNHTGGHESGHDEHDDHGGGGHQLIVNIAYCTVSAGLIALIISMAGQPLLLGYILGGILVGPIGLKLIESAEAINTISEFGLILLLFMIGLELDVSELLKMGKVVILTGFLQFPACAIIHIIIFTVLDLIGIGFGEGSYSVMYMAVCCGISSTMIVVKLLSEKMETDSPAGRLTIGVLIFQDMWAIVVMAIQPNLANINPIDIGLTFVMMGLLLFIAFTYAKFVLPAVFFQASESMELLLVLSLAWCFFICCIALLPWFNLSMELAALIAGVAMATFPYSAELNGKVKYIRDYFITLYFVSLGMQIPPITIAPILKALLVCFIVLAVRWIGIFGVVATVDGFNYRDNRLAVVATMNLSEVSEFGLVLCSIGKGLGHVETDTFTIMIWVFSILAVGASYFIKFNQKAYGVISKLTAKKTDEVQEPKEGHHNSDHDFEHDIVLLGYSKTAAALVSEVKDKSPLLKKRLHVICQKSAKKMAKLKDQGVSCTFGDIGTIDVLEHAMPHGEYPIQLVIVTQSNDELGSRYTNLDLMNTVRRLPRCKDSKFILTASTGSTELYENGAGYVIKPAKLQAERLCDMLIGYVSNVGDDMFAKDAKAQRVEDVFKESLARDEKRGGGRQSMVEDDDEGILGGRSKKAKGIG